jgi:hypothetical protein
MLGLWDLSRPEAQVRAFLSIPKPLLSNPHGSSIISLFPLMKLKVQGGDT